MKGITLTPPWGTLVAIGAKRIETRSWPTSHRGLLAIHQASGLNGLRAAGEPKIGSRELEKRLAALCDSDPFYGALRAHLSGYTAAERSSDLPRGMLVAVARLTGCVPTEDIDIAAEVSGSAEWGPPMGHPQIRALVEQERAFGDFTPGRWAWTFDHVVNLHDGIECSGGRALWDVPADVLDQLRDLVEIDE